MVAFERGSKYKLTDLLRDKPLDAELVQDMCFAQHVPRRAELTDYHSLTACSPLVSERIKNSLEEFNLKNVQFLPATVNDKRGTVHLGYFILHVCNLIECLDKENAIWEPSENKAGRASEIKKLVLNHEALAATPLEERLVFCVWENRMNLLFHRTVVQKILECNPVGLAVQPVEHWDSSLPYTETNYSEE